METILLSDIREKAELVMKDEESIRRRFLERKKLLEESKYAETKRDLGKKRQRICELEKLIESAYEDKVAGKSLHRIHRKVHGTTAGIEM